MKSLCTITGCTKGALLALACTLLASTALASEPSPADQKAIEQAGNEWVAAFKSGDLERLLRLYEPDATVALHDQPMLQGIDAIRKYFSQRVGRGEVEFLTKLERVQVDGRTAYALSAYWFTLKVPGRAEPFRDAGRSLLVYRRDDAGQWLIQLDIDQTTPDVSFPEAATSPPPAS
ncbi:MAG: SgcJ/EcaC family oxidoreductase [Steroidobacteraceae bacterium]